MSGRRDAARARARSRDVNLISNKLPGKFALNDIVGWMTGMMSIMSGDGDEDEGEDVVDDDDDDDNDSTFDLLHVVWLGG